MASNNVLNNLPGKSCWYGHVWCCYSDSYHDLCFLHDFSLFIFSLYSLF